MKKIPERENPFAAHFVYTGEHGRIRQRRFCLGFNRSDCSVPLSVLFMSAIVAEFLHIQSKRVNLLKSLRSERAGVEFKQGRILMWIYILATIVMVSGTLFLYFIHPQFS